MSDKLKTIRDRIVIDQTSPGGQQLMQCFFLPGNVDEAYNVYDQQANLLAANVVSGQDFNFTVEGVHFEISDFFVDVNLAKGNWNIPSDGLTSATAPTGDTGGSFQASSSGGGDAYATSGADTTEAVAPPTTPTGAYEVTATGTSDASKFTGCYFTLSGTTWILYNKSGNQIATGQTSATGFTFDHDAKKGSSSTKITWTITNFQWTTVNGVTTASGSWSNNDDAVDNAPQSGSFQASSSGTIDPLSASASA